MQRYYCVACKHPFQSIRRPARQLKKLFHQYVWGKQNLTQLGAGEGRSAKWVRQQLSRVTPEVASLTPGPTVMIADVTFWGKYYGVCVFRSPHLKKNLWWTEVERETTAVYREGKFVLEQQEWTLPAIVIDGRRGVATFFARPGIPVQICHFHQMKTVTKYLTRKPLLRASQELRFLTMTLPRTDEVTFTKQLDQWYERWQPIVDEKTYIIGYKHWYYTHHRVRAAYRSLRTNVPYLFTYQKYPELHIPNTTNSLDGMFSQLKNRLNVHRGARPKFRYKIITEILSGEH